VTTGAEVLVVGAGIAGASAAYELAGAADVVLLEAESQPGYHASGRSAAMFVEDYGNRVIRALNRASRGFLTSPPDGFAELPILTPRGSLAVATEANLAAVDELVAESPTARRISAEEAYARVPILAAGRYAGGALQACDQALDVHVLLQGYLRGLAHRGGRRVDNARVSALKRVDGRWRAETRAGSFEAPVVVDAAGAWADELAGLAGLAPIGIAPLRRTALIVEVPGGLDAEAWPLVFELVVDPEHGHAEALYFRPESGMLLLSPANEDPEPPCDAQPDELDIAIAVDRFETMTGASVVKAHRAWAGLRSFAPDRTPVVGFDPRAEGFFWLAGQGGYGFQTAPAMARCAAALIRSGSLPADVAAGGVAAADLSPARFR